MRNQNAPIYSDIEGDKGNRSYCCGYTAFTSFDTSARLFTFIWLTDKTDWRIEDYMCTLPDGCDEYIVERKKLREQKEIRAFPKSN